MLITDSNYDLSQAQSTTVISFDPSIDPAVLQKAVNDYIDYVADIDPAKQPQLSLRNLPTSLLVEGLHVCFSRTDIKSPSILLNVYDTVKRYNTLDNSFFDSQDVWFTSIEQFLDAKIALRSKIQAFTDKMAFYYLSCIYSMHKVEYTMLEHHEAMPDIYLSFMLTSDFYTLSALVAKANNIQTKDLVLIDNAYAYITELCLRSNLAAKLFESL